MVLIESHTVCYTQDCLEGCPLLSTNLPYGLLVKVRKVLSKTFAKCETRAKSRGDVCPIKWCLIGQSDFCM